jgi:hypothetical protein
MGLLQSRKSEVKIKRSPPDQSIACTCDLTSFDRSQKTTPKNASDPKQEFTSKVGQRASLPADPKLRVAEAPGLNGGD